MQELTERFTTKVRGRTNDSGPTKFTTRSTSQTTFGTATQGAASFSFAPNKRRRSPSIKKGHAKVEEEKKVDQRRQETLILHEVRDGWWLDKRVHNVKIFRAEIEESFLDTIATNVFDGSHELWDFTIKGIKVVNGESGEDVTSAALANFIRKAIHKGEDSGKNVCMNFTVEAQR